MLLSLYATVNLFLIHFQCLSILQTGKSIFFIKTRGTINLVRYHSRKQNTRCNLRQVFFLLESLRCLG